MNEQTEWGTLPELYRDFCTKHPELVMPSGVWGMYNTLRGTRERLLAADAIRKARKHWIGHRERFPVVLFDLLTGREPS